MRSIVRRAAFRNQQFFVQQNGGRCGTAVISAGALLVPSVIPQLLTSGVSVRLVNFLRKKYFVRHCAIETS